MEMGVHLDNDINKNALILIALGNAFTEQATYLTGMLKHKPKQTFNAAVGAIDLFIKTVEDGLSPDEFEFISGITDIYHNINLEIKKNELKD